MIKLMCQGLTNPYDRVHCVTCNLIRRLDNYPRISYPTVFSLDKKKGISEQSCLQRAKRHDPLREKT